MILAHEIALDPHQPQTPYFAKAFGVARFASNRVCGKQNSEQMRFVYGQGNGLRALAHDLNAGNLLHHEA